MRRVLSAGAALAALAIAAPIGAQTETYFTPLTESAPVVPPNDVAELNAPWVTPSGVIQTNLVNMDEVENSIYQSIVRVPAGNVSSMFDMLAFAPGGRYIYIPHETPIGAGVSRHDVEQRFTEVLFAGDQGGANGDWSNDYAAFDPARFTPNKRLWLGEEWSGEGRIIEVINPRANASAIRTRELQSIANVSHEGIEFSNKNPKIVYYVDEWNSGAIYKFVSRDSAYNSGRTFVLSVDAFDGVSADLWNDPSNVGKVRTGPGRWIPLTDGRGNPLTSIDPFRNGPTDDPRTNPATRGGRGAADEVGATPYGRPEDTIIKTLANGNEALFFAATSETTVYVVEMLGERRVHVREFLSEASTPKNLGFDPTTGVLNSPDNLALDALGNVYVIEDAPNSSSTGGDIWFARDIDNDGVAESLDHFLSIQVAGSEATGMIFHPRNPAQFAVAVQHPTSTDLSVVPNGFGDAVWMFDVSAIMPKGERGRERGRR